MFKVKFVVNPVSANGRTGKRWHLIEESLRQRGIENFSVEYTERPLHAIEISRRAILDGYDIITAVGGDGTINEVLNGFVEEDGRINSTTAMAFISTATGGDFKRMFNADHDKDEKINNILNAKREISCDIVKADFVSRDGDNISRYYINVADLGLGGETCLRINQGSKYLGGFLSFLAAVLASLVKHKSFEVAVNIDGNNVFNGKLTELALANGRFFGGGMMVAPTAEIDDGLLDVVIINDMKKIEFLRCLPQVYSGKHLNHPKVEVFKGKKMAVKCSQKIWLEMDGETPGTSNLTLEVIPSAIRLVY